MLTPNRYSAENHCSSNRPDTLARRRLAPKEQDFYVSADPLLAFGVESPSYVNVLAWDKTLRSMPKLDSKVLGLDLRQANAPQLLSVSIVS